MPFHTNNFGLGKRHWNLESSPTVVEFQPPYPAGPYKMMMFVYIAYCAQYTVLYCYVVYGILVFLRCRYSEGVPKLCGGEPGHCHTNQGTPGENRELRVDLPHAGPGQSIITLSRTQSFKTFQFVFRLYNVLKNTGAIVTSPTVASPVV